MQKKNISRRDFLRSAAAGSALVAASGILSASAFAAESGEAYTWNYEADMVVVGSGCGILGAIAATEKGGSAIIVEKAGLLGGTTIRSGGQFWVPANHRMALDGAGADFDNDCILQYLKQSDAMNGSTDEQKMDFIVNGPKVFQYFEEQMGFPLASVNLARDYYNIPYIHNGRTLNFADPEKDPALGEGGVLAPKAYALYLEPALEERNIPVLYETAAKELIQDESGRVIGLKAEAPEGPIYIKANKGVLLAAGGFDWNEEMRRTYLRGPLYGSGAAATNTGDGILMGMALGADLGCMHSTLGGTTFITDPEAEEYKDFEAYSACMDFSTYRSVPHSMIVNKLGKRFMDEACSYAAASETFYTYDTKTFSFINLPAYMIFTEGYMEYMGAWPRNAKEQPAWVMGPYESLEALAEAQGIDAEGLKAEVERFNGFCETGVDADFARGEGPYAQYRISTYTSKPGFGDPALVNPLMGKVEGKEYYVALIGPGSYGTKGGLKVNFDSQVINTMGEVIPGLYAAGTNASAILGFSYGGAGGSLGPGFYQALRAANHCMELGML